MAVPVARRLTAALAGLAVVGMIVATAGCDSTPGASSNPSTTPAPTSSTSSAGGSPTASPTGSPRSTPKGPASGAAPAPVSTCTWPKVRLGTSPVLLLASASKYYLVSLPTGQVTATCPVAVDTATVTAQPASVNGAVLAPDDASTAQRWYGALAPGGSGGTTVPTKSGIKDLATGRGTNLRAPNQTPAMVGREDLVRMNTVNAEPGKPPTSSSSWCTVTLTDRSFCQDIPGAKSAGTPVIDPKGAVRWAPLEVVPTAVQVAGTAAAVKTDGTRIVAVVPASGTGGELPAIISAGGNGWTQRMAKPTDRLTWVASATGPAGLQAQQPPTTWQDIAVALGWPETGSAGFAVLDAAITADGSLLVLARAKVEGSANAPIGVVGVTPAGAVHRYFIQDLPRNRAGFTPDSHFVVVPTALQPPSSDAEPTGSVRAGQ